ncbi:MAG: hypothetical protein WC584_04565, partial [Candidatus Pacearchaeota archaeon]
MTKQYIYEILNEHNYSENCLAYAQKKKDEVAITISKFAESRDYNELNDNVSQLTNRLYNIEKEIHSGLRPHLGFAFGKYKGLEHYLGKEGIKQYHDTLETLGLIDLREDAPRCPTLCMDNATYKLDNCMKAVMWSGRAMRKEEDLIFFPTLNVMSNMMGVASFIFTGWGLYCDTQFQEKMFPVCTLMGAGVGAFFYAYMAIGDMIIHHEKNPFSHIADRMDA